MYDSWPPAVAMDLETLTVVAFTLAAAAVVGYFVIYAAVLAAFRQNEIDKRRPGGPPARP